ncbi:MAG TPA: PBPRA1643 family SWIM/SEC-C metal-binding motif protein [Candidatus Binatia bacterium]
MGNKITDIGRMKSRVDEANRLRKVDIHKSVRLGTEKNPANVRVRTEKRLKEVTALFNKNGWSFKAALEPDQPEDVADLERLLHPPAPQRVEKKPGRNEACSCGSGKKYKNCCGQ